PEGNSCDQEENEKYHSDQLNVILQELPCQLSIQDSQDSPHEIADTSSDQHSQKKASVGNPGYSCRQNKHFERGGWGQNGRDHDCPQSPFAVHFQDLVQISPSQLPVDIILASTAHQVQKRTTGHRSHDRH